MVAVASVGAVGLALVASAPATGASGERVRAAKPRVSLDARGGLGSFTPAARDSRLAALLARAQGSTSGLRFTPASASVRVNRSVTVAVRARTSGGPRGERIALVAAPAGNGITPVGYDLGVALGWKRFALVGDVARVDLGAIGGREKADVGVAYSGRSWSGRLTVGADRPTQGTARPLAEGPGYSVDLGGSYSIARNVDLTAGVRYRASERDRLLPLRADDRRDSQAVYIGTAVKF